MILTIEEARATLRVDGTANDAIITPLLQAIPGYITTCTGVPFVEGQATELHKTLAKFLLQLWYNPDGTDADRLQIVIDNLIRTLKAQAVYNGSSLGS